MGSIADSQTAETEAGSDSEFEPWLQQAARAPSIERSRLPLVGQVVGGKYRIEEALGAGGMGAVFRATHVVSDKPVALKWMLRPASDEVALQRLTREARAAGRIDHPNVVDVYDIGHEDGASYLVMELLHGESFRKRLAHAPLEPSQVVELLLPAMYGVAAAHRAGVVHRDLKPDNIFLCNAHDGEPRRTKVVDFGISAIMSSELSKQTVLTDEGAMLGTPAYLAPEQVEGGASADIRTDIYAFGVILYEALTGSVPFKSNSYLGLALAIVKSAPVEPRALRPEISVELQSVVMQALHKDRRQRHQTMVALINALLPFASAHTSLSESAPPSRLTAPFARRLALLALVLAGSAAAWLWWGRSPVPDAHILPASIASARAEPPPTGALPQFDPSPSLPPPAPATSSTTQQPQATPAPARPARASAAKHATPPHMPKTLSDLPEPRRPRAGAIRSDEL